MSIIGTIATLKAKFASGAKPNAQAFTDLIDSCYSGITGKEVDTSGRAEGTGLVYDESAGKYTHSVLLTPGSAVNRVWVGRIASPTTGSIYVLGRVKYAATISSSFYITDTGTAPFNVEIRASTTPDAAGTDIWTADKTASSTGTETTTFDVSGVDADEWLVLVVTSASGSPNELIFSIEVAEEVTA